MGVVNDCVFEVNFFPIRGNVDIATRLKNRYFTANDQSDIHYFLYFPLETEKQRLLVYQ